MPTLDEVWPLVAVIAAAYAVQTSIGFGANLVSVALGALFVPVEQVVLCVVPLSTLQAAYITARHHRSVAWGLVAKRVFPIMGAGVLVGSLVIRPFAGRWLDVGVAVMIVGVALLGLRSLIRGPIERAPARADEAVAGGALLAAGLAQGIAAVGGPPLVYALERLGLDKAAFRSTLSVAWLVFNSVLVAVFAWEHKYDEPVALLALLPAMGLGVVLGELVFARLPARAFHAAVNVMLLIAAVAVVARLISR